MKNLHVLTTDKPNFGKYLVLNKEGKLCIWNTNTMGSQKTLSTQHIYITSDEEIKNGDWHLKLPNKTIGSYPLNSINPNKGRYKKIILTTDQDLIADGVQAIDDDFLEWFVKNPSCENVGIEPDYDEVRGDYYKIVTPKEEPKQETLEEDAEIKFNVFQKENPIVPKNHIQPFKLGFINGAKWQSERMYSEEDMKQFGLYLGDNIKKLKGKTIDEIFEQFKKESMNKLEELHKKAVESKIFIDTKKNPLIEFTEREDFEFINGIEETATKSAEITEQIAVEFGKFLLWYTPVGDEYGNLILWKNVHTQETKLTEQLFQEFLKQRQ